MNNENRERENVLNEIMRVDELKCLAKCRCFEKISC